MQNDTLKSLIAYCQEHNCICPQPQEWNELWEMLPARERKGDGWEPALPLILAAWHDTPAMLKMLRLQEHIRWADEHGVLQEISIFIRGLSESNWFHIGD